MKLIYQGKRGEFINEVPARDLEAQDVQVIATKWGKSIAETEGLLIQHGLYKAEKEERPTKLSRPQYPRDSQSTDESEQE